MYNCPNCGAPITSSKCDYCGIVFPKSDLELENERLRSEIELIKQQATIKQLSDLELENERRRSEIELIKQQMTVKQLYDDAVYAMRGYANGVLTPNEVRELVGLERRKRYG